MKTDYFESDEFLEILKSYEESKESGNICYLDEDDYADIADYYMNQNIPQAGMECAEDGLEVHPNSVLLMSVKSGLLIFYHRYSEARAIIDDIPENLCTLDIFYQKAQLKYALDGDLDTAEEMFREWIELQKQDEIKNGNREDDVYIRDSYAHVITSFIDLAEDRFYDDELVKRWVDEYLVTFSPIGICNSDLVLADILREERMLDMVEKYYIKLLENDPYIEKGYYILATAQNLLGHYEESVESCEFALAIDPKDWDAKSLQANNFCLLNNYTKALSLFEEVVDEFGDNSQSLSYAKCLVYCNKITEALEQLENAEEFAIPFKDHDPEFYAEVFAEIADTYMMCDHFTEGLVAIDEALSVVPDNTRYLLTKGSLILFMGNDLQLALDYFEMSLDTANDKMILCVNVAARLIYQNEYDRALEWLDRSMMFVDSTLGADDTLRIIPAYRALVYHHKKDLENFVRNLDEACIVCPDVVGGLFADMIPADVAPKDFASYYVDKLKKLIEQQNK